MTYAVPGIFARKNIGSKNIGSIRLTQIEELFSGFAIALPRKRL
jgi:hypothetical protein